MAFILGVLGTFFAFILQIVVWFFHPELFTLHPPLTTPLFLSLLFLSFSEELARALFADQYLKRYAKGSWPIAALLFGIGFSLLEIILTYWQGFSWEVLRVSAFHILATLFTFWWFAQRRSRTSLAFLIILLTGVHTCFNLTVLYWTGG